MDILDLLNNRAFSQVIIWGGAIMLGVLYLIGRLIFYALFPSKNKLLKTKSFDEEAEENRNKPLFSESIGSVSVRLGEDVRDVWEMGYSNDQINGVLTGKYTLEEMYKMEPDGNTTSSKGKEILANKSQIKE